jgi:hypothetical protein
MAELVEEDQVDDIPDLVLVFCLRQRNRSVVGIHPLDGIGSQSGGGGAGQREKDGGNQKRGTMHAHAAMAQPVKDGSVHKESAQQVHFQFRIRI